MRVQAAELWATAGDTGGFPPPGLPEVAFLGRSNVGKSSLLNRLVNRKQLARTSRAPGRTRLLHWYRVRGPGREIVLVDLPGYGYAKISRAARSHWKRLVETYLEGRRVLRVAVLLQDLRRDLSEDEALLLSWLAEREIPVILALTKVDKEKPARRAARARQLTAEAGLPPGRVVATSAQKGTGIPELWKAIDSFL